MTMNQDINNPDQPNHFSTPDSQLAVTPTTSSWWQKPVLSWNNLSIRAKITILLVTGATIPVVVATQGIVGLARESALSNLKETLRTDLLILDKSIESETRQIKDSSNILAQSVTAAGINLDDPATTTAQQAKLRSFLQVAKDLKPNASFYLIANSKGQTIAQSVQVARDDFAKYPLLPKEDGIASTQFSPVASKSGIELGDLSIIQAALSKSRSLSGVELLKSKYLQRLGLAEQAKIGIRTQATQGLSDLKKPCRGDKPPIKLIE